MRRSYWPDPEDDEDDEEPSEARRLIEEISRELDQELRAEFWDYVGSVFDEIRERRGKP